MARGRKRQNKTTKETTSKKLKNDMRQAVLDKICKELYESSEKNGRKKPYGSVAKIVNDMKTDFPWMNRDVVNYAFKTYKERMEAPADSEGRTAASENDVVAAPQQKKSGRPVGSTLLNKFKKDVATRLCLDEVAIRYHRMREQARALGKQGKKKGLSDIITEVKKIYELGDEVKINESTIRGREFRKKLIVKSMGPASPMVDVEPVLVDLIIKMSAIRRCLTPTQCLHLANDLVAGTETEKRVIEFKEKIYKKKYEKADLGLNYWNGFRRRWENVLTSKRGQKFALDRSSATTFTNIMKMYDEVYEAMTESGVATKLDDPVCMDRDSNITSQEQCFGTQCTHTLDHPHYCLVVDEVGSNLSQKGDGHVGGQKYVCARGAIPQVKVQHSERHFTLLGFTALSGEPVLCLIIISGVREHLNIETGIDPTKPILGDVNDENFIEQNFGPDKLFPGGPTCQFNGKEIPCMVRWSPKGSITSQILADSLAHIDSFQVFDRSNGMTPFLLLDGHNSRFDLPFLEYIMDDAHRWTVCIGVPYGTAIWQVADSKEQNGSYKIALTRAKKEMLDTKLALHIEPASLCATDIMPLVNKAWSSSFARVAMNKKAIAERGWGPLNRNLLLYKEVQHTMTKLERETFNGTIHNNPPLLAVDINSDNSTAVSDLSNVSQKFVNSRHHQKVISLNYSSGNSAMVLDTIVAENDLREARERNRIKKQEGEDMMSKLNDVKSVTAMYHFNQLGCKIGMDALDKKKEIFKMQQAKLLEARKKEEHDFRQKETKYNQVMALKLSDDKLTAAQLKILLTMKKRKSDSPFHSLKKAELQQLWKEWQWRQNVVPAYENNLVASITEVTAADTITEVSDPEFVHDNVAGV